MLTKKVRKLRKDFSRAINMGDLLQQSHLSDDILNELIDNCKPTKEEFDSMANKLIMHSKSFYRLIMEAKDNWNA